MKKIFILIVVLLIILFNSFYNKNTFSLRDYFSTGKLTQYTKGESLYFNNLEVGKAIEILNAEIKFVEYIEDRALTIIYCYTDKIKTSVYSNDKKINLQIAYCDNYSVIGWPMIFGSF